MTRWSGSSGGTESRSVVLNVYDLHWSVVALNGLLDAAGIGAYHVGIQVYGVEFMFANCAANGDSSVFHNGIIRHFPQSHTVHVFREAIDLGPTELSPDEVVEAVDAMKGDWAASTYSFATKNCIHFACALALVLGATPVPDRIVGGVEVLASVASLCETILPYVSVPLSVAHAISLSSEAVIDGSGTRSDNACGKPGDDNITRETSGEHELGRYVRETPEAMLQTGAKGVL